MAEPKQKLPSSRTDQRRNRISINIPEGIKCPKCKQLTKRHVVCPSCGYYKGEKIL